MSIVIGNWNDTLPAAPAENDNIKFQIDRTASPPNVSGYVPRADITGTKYGTIIYDASENPLKYLGADGNWHDIPNDLPTGGTTGQVLAKASNDNYDTEWIDAPSGESGISITRSDVTGSRSVTTVYQNTSSHPLFVAIRLYGASGAITATVYTDAASTPTTVVSGIYQTSGYSTSLCFIVEPSHYYKLVQTSGTVTVLNWNEYELTGVSITNSGSLTGSRTWTTVYQNTGSDPLLVMLIITSTSTYTISVASDLVSSPTELVWQQRSRGSGIMPVYFLVPPGHYYKITYDIAMTITEWIEYTLSGLTALKSPNLSSDRAFANYYTTRNDFKARLVAGTFTPAGLVQGYYRLTQVILLQQVKKFGVMLLPVLIPECLSVL
jgi:hypothetical protein